MSVRRSAPGAHLAALAALTLLAAAPAAADRRAFTFSYEPSTLPRGGLELEQYLTASSWKVPNLNDHDLGWQYQVEAEYGVTDRLELALYQVFGAGEPGTPVTWNGYKVRGRYRFSDQGDWFVDPALYLELFQEADGAVGVEEKIILGRTFGRLLTTVNLTFEQERLNRSAREYSIAPSLGVAYQPRPWVSFGAELLSKHELAGDEWETQLFLGPVVSFAASRVWLTVTTFFRLVGEAEAGRPREDYRVRLILGINL